MRPLAYGLCVVYFAICAYFELLVKPSCHCGLAEDPKRVMAFPDEASALQILRRASEVTVESVVQAWGQADRHPEISGLRLKGKPVKIWSVSFAGSEPNRTPVVLATDRTNHPALASLLALSRGFSSVPHKSPIILAVIDFQPTEELPPTPPPFTEGAPIIFLDDLPAAKRPSLPLVYRRYFDAKRATPEVIGDYPSRHIVKLASGFLTRFSEQATHCFRPFPGVPEVRSPHSKWFAGTGFTTALFYGGVTTDLANLGDFTKAWYFTMLSFSNAAS